MDLRPIVLTVRGKHWWRQRRGGKDLMSFNAPGKTVGDKIQPDVVFEERLEAREH